MTAREEALVPRARMEDEVIRLDLLEAEAPPAWREAVTGGPRAGARRRAVVALSVASAATDLACILVAMALAGVAAPGSDGTGVPGWLLITGAALGWVAVFAAHGLYRPLDLAAHDEFRRLLAATSLGALGLTMAVTLGYRGSSRPGRCGPGSPRWGSSSSAGGSGGRFRVDCAAAHSRAGR